MYIWWWYATPSKNWIKLMLEFVQICYWSKWESSIKGEEKRGDRIWIAVASIVLNCAGTFYILCCATEAQSKSPEIELELHKILKYGQRWEYWHWAEYRNSIWNPWRQHNGHVWKGIPFKSSDIFNIPFLGTIYRISLGQLTVYTQHMTSASVYIYT